MSEQHPAVPVEFRVRPSPALAALCVVLGGAAILAIHLSLIPIWLRLALSLVAMIAVVVAAHRFLKPELRVRVIENAIEYQPRSGSAWRRIGSAQTRFISPWYVGWRGKNLGAYGVFSGQLAADDFRRLAVQLRHRGVD